MIASPLSCGTTFVSCTTEVHFTISPAGKSGCRLFFRYMSFAEIIGARGINRSPGGGYLASVTLTGIWLTVLWCRTFKRRCLFPFLELEEMSILIQREIFLVKFSSVLSSFFLAIVKLSFTLLNFTIHSFLLPDRSDVTVQFDKFLVANKVVKENWSENMSTNILNTIWYFIQNLQVITGYRIKHSTDQLFIYSNPFLWKKNSQ